MPTIATKWTGRHHTLSWFDAKNWTKGVPTMGQTTKFTDGGTWAISLASSASAQAGSMTVLGDNLTFGGGTLALNAPPPKHGAALDLIIGGGGAVQVSADATLTANSEILIGTNGSGALSVLGSVTTQTLFDYLGTVLVEGLQAHLTVTSAAVIGNHMLVTGGATVDDANTPLSIIEVGWGGSPGDGTLTVDGVGTSLSTARIYLGNGYSGTLTVQQGAHVTTGYINAGQSGDGFLQVNGKGSVVTTDGLTIGGQVPVSSTATVTAAGTLAVGAGGVLLEEGTLKLDSTAHFSSSGEFISLAGRIDAIATTANHPGTVTLSEHLFIGQDGFDGNQVTNLYTEGGATLKLTGGVEGSAGSILQVGAGTVVLTNGKSQYGATQIYSGKLVVAATGALGDGTFTFLRGAAVDSVLQVNANASFGNLIAGFGAHDSIDLRGFAFGAGVTENFANGTLTLTGASASTSLTLSGSYSTNDFIVQADNAGGTLILFHN